MPGRPPRAQRRALLRWRASARVGSPASRRSRRSGSPVPRCGTRVRTATSTWNCWPARAPAARRATGTSPPYWNTSPGSWRRAASGEAILRGDVVPLPAPLPGGTMTSLYAGLPVYFDEDFFSVTVENGSGVAVVWLIPVTADEAAFIQDKGWEAFEDALVRQDPDLLDPDRPQLDL
ncbi:suppressor of fused domain protein [Kitasatospora sp. NPDC057015]|uniref:suppressor of fused domain protein n=1 Tax=Kitasatospora sp. NPDC057015 TaxID=3346001 RepID=UPI00364371AC